MHLATHIHPTIAVSSLVKDIKVSSSISIKENNLFPGFNGWQEGYSAFTYSVKEKHSLVKYIENQEATIKQKHLRIDWFIPWTWDRFQWKIFAIVQLRRSWFQYEIIPQEPPVAIIVQSLRDLFQRIKIGISHDFLDSFLFWCAVDSEVV